MLDGLRWPLIVALSATGILMALVSCLVGLRPKSENPAWWGLYAIWIIVALTTDAPRPFTTLVIASGFAGLFHGITQALLLDRYIANNPWHAERMTASKIRLRTMFIITGVVIGVVAGVVVGGVATGISRL